MPFRSQAQRRLFQGIAHGWKPSGLKGGPSEEVAQKFIADSKDDTPPSLPEHVSGQRKAFGHIAKGRK